jgi:hypothetical protein
MKLKIKTKQMQLPQTIKHEKPIMDSYFPLFSFLLIVIFVPLILFVLVLQIRNFSNVELVVIGIFLFLVTSVITSYFVLYRVKIYSTSVEVYYFIRHNSRRKRIIKNEDIAKVRYNYINGRGSHSVLKIYYTENGTNRIIDYTGNSTQSVYAKALKNFKDKDITVEINPPDVLSEYGL